MTRGGRARPITILSIDGGGVRGLFAALIVRDILRRVRFLSAFSRARRRLLRRSPESVQAHQVFDVFAGTSTGALVALGLVKPGPYTPGQLVDLYRQHARRIFPPARFDALRAVRHAFSEKYDEQPFEDLLREWFGEERLSQCLANILVAAYDTDNREPYFFKHYDEDACRRVPRLCRPGHAPDFRLRDVARATTAAPTYFEAARVTSLDGRSVSLVDGGLVANNPALSAYVEARKIYPRAHHFLVVSIGTGSSTRRFPHEVIRRWGYIDWVSPIHGVPITAMMWDGQSEAVAHALKELPRVTYFRFNAPLEGVTEEMDDARPENLAAIERLARATIHRKRHSLHRLALQLYGRRVRPAQRSAMMRSQASGTALTG